VGTDAEAGNLLGQHKAPGYLDTGRVGSRHSWARRNMVGEWEGRQEGSQMERIGMEEERTRRRAFEPSVSAVVQIVAELLRSRLET
jgi:hypothetical protein